MTPGYGVDDGTTLNFDATLVLATMLASQLREGNASLPPAEAAGVQAQSEPVTALGALQNRNGASGSENQSNHTRIWSELSGRFSYIRIM